MLGTLNRTLAMLLSGYTEGTMIKVSEFRPACASAGTASPGPPDPGRDGHSCRRPAGCLRSVACRQARRPCPGNRRRGQPMGPRAARRHSAHPGPARQDRPVLRRRALPGPAGMVGPPWSPARDHPRRCPRRRRAAARRTASADPGRRPVAVRLGDEERRHLPRPGQPPKVGTDRAADLPAPPARADRPGRRGGHHPARPGLRSPGSRARRPARADPSPPAQRR